MQFSRINFRLGRINRKCYPIKVFDDRIINFLNSLSKNIMSEKKSRLFPDLFSFGFWCIKENMNKLKNSYNSQNLMFGRGIAFHVCPSNVPMNFAYSLVFGLLSGNDNIIRLPSRNFDQSELLIKIIKKILKKKIFKFIVKKICLISYDKSDQISQIISEFSNVRLIWGGDETIKKFKKFDTNPRSIDLYFSNRYSISVISTDKLKYNKDNNLLKIANNFYNDAFTMDQLGCSSPQAIFFVGKTNSNIKKFWKILQDITNNKYIADYSVANKKFALMSENIIKNKINVKASYDKFNLIRLKINNLKHNIEDFQNGFGTFFEINIKNLESLKKIISNRYQTLSYYGFKKEDLKKFISKNHLLGIDRIVPIGRAFDMGHIWDGYDLIESLSRKVAE